MVRDLESDNEIRVTDIDGVVLVRITMSSAGRVARTMQRLFDDGLINLVNGIYSLESVIDGQLVDEIYWMTPSQARAVLQRFGATETIQALISDHLQAANDSIFVRDQI